ncbi:hypothetical protein ACIRRA_09360 [Nocardia sp. NPDC101769]|uniref:hypothetical protein n=1 Tax=Nocardia sp. NPDC101769 TaxID=3364333 RepID=UPI00380B5CE4
MSSPAPQMVPLIARLYFLAGIAARLYLLAGLIAAVAGRAPSNPALRLLWWADAALCAADPATRIPVGMAADELASRIGWDTAALAPLLGRTRRRDRTLLEAS